MGKELQRVQALLRDTKIAIYRKVRFCDDCRGGKLTTDICNTKIYAAAKEEELRAGERCSQKASSQGQRRHKLRPLKRRF